MAELPSGTVTFLFTDIEGSTRLLHELGDGYAAALAEHRRVLREIFERHDGTEVDTQGDAFFVAFARASDALAAAAAAQAALTGPVRVRIGIHTGEPVVTPEGYVGLDVHRAARIAAAAHGGQTLVSRSTRDLVAPDMLRDLGEHRLKDLLAPEQIFQLGPEDFPPPRSLDATNLPVATTRLVGRTRELAELVAALGDSARLLTVTGPGGSGKTRLGLQAAAELAQSFPGGVFFVTLAGVGEPGLVAATIAATVGVRALAELRDRRALLVLDNFEHLLDAAPVVSELLHASTGVKVLATSRSPLRVEGELEYPLDPLPDTDALALLAERARAVRPDFEPDDAAAEICRRVDGLPLALELAASRLRSLEATALLERLDRRLPLLTGGRRDAPERQRTLRATILWSYDLLDPQRRPIFERLGVFATFTLAAAEEVAEADLADVDALVEASLLKPVGGDRFLMLETIRELALERLEARGETGEARDRHLACYLALARSANLNMESDGPMLHALVARDHDNVRAALAWAVESGDGERGLELVGALENLWMTKDAAESRRWIEALLPLTPQPPSHLHALAVRCLGNAASIAGEAAAGQLYRESYDEFRLLGEERWAAVTFFRVAAHEVWHGDRARGRELLETCLGELGAIGLRKGECQCLSLLGDLERESGAPEQALVYYARSVELARETGFTWWERSVHLGRSAALAALGRPRDAAEAAADSVRVAVSIGDRPGTIWGLGYAARAEAHAGRLERAGRIWGATLVEGERAPVAGWRPLLEIVEPALQAAAGAELEQGIAAGRRLTLDAVVALVLEDAGS
jgi:predicted ATPase/class 3 adenylate cyclase